MPCSHCRASPVWAMAENGQQSHFVSRAPPIRKASQVACCWLSASWALLLAFLFSGRGNWCRLLTLLFSVGHLLSDRGLRSAEKGPSCRMRPVRVRFVLQNRDLSSSVGSDRMYCVKYEWGPWLTTSAARRVIALLLLDTTAGYSCMSNTSLAYMLFYSQHSPIHSFSRSDCADAALRSTSMLQLQQ